MDVNQEVYLNRTKLYLAPILNVINANLKNVEAYGIYDVKYENVHAEFTRDYHIFILNNPYLNTSEFAKALTHIRKSQYYVDDYLFDLNKKNKHMIIMRIPEEYHHSYDAFVIGRFSRMYSVSDLEKLKIPQRTSNGKVNAPWYILTKDASYRKFFISRINEIFGNILDDDHEPLEYDVFHVKPKKEGFND